jgi:hypothetical protein
VKARLDAVVRPFEEPGGAGDLLGYRLTGRGRANVVEPVGDDPRQHSWCAGPLDSGF